MINFKRPYFAKSIQEFWSRWHISLSTWFRDYLYIPLGGNRVNTWKWYRNLFLVFAISGFWHGANWTFIIWGALHGIYLIGGILWKKINFFEQIKIPNWLSNSTNILITISLVTIAWVYFRATTVEQANTIIKNVISLKPGQLFIGIPSTFAYCFLGIFILSIVEFFQKYYPAISLLNNKNYLIRYSTYISIVIAIILFGVFNGGQFIYFQF